MQDRWHTPLEGNPEQLDADLEVIRLLLEEARQGTLDILYEPKPDNCGCRVPVYISWGSIPYRARPLLEKEGIMNEDHWRAHESSGFARKVQYVSSYILKHSLLQDKDPTEAEVMLPRHQAYLQ